MITGRQVRAARALLNWKQEMLAEKALVALTALKRQAARAAYLRGHQMHWTAGTAERSTELRGRCKRCGHSVVCTSMPRTNETSISGSALQSNCAVAAGLPS